jgi:hypothetical protein
MKYLKSPELVILYNNMFTGWIKTLYALTFLSTHLTAKVAAGWGKGLLFYLTLT